MMYFNTNHNNSLEFTIYYLISLPTSIDRASAGATLGATQKSFVNFNDAMQELAIWANHGTA
jgi:hypothetical protein